MEVKMERKNLKHKPLVEAIFELRWDLQEKAPGIKKDQNYNIFLGRLYDRVIKEYSFHEELPTANMPDEISGYVIQHRFRKDKDKWPLIQVGPGIITLNDTEGYTWDDFEKRINHLLKILFEAYPNADNSLTINWLLLRYIDAIDFNYEKENIFDFLKEKLKADIQIHKELFEETGVSNLPLGFDLRFSFPSVKPKGAVLLRFARGKKRDVNALIWETQVQSIGDDVPKIKDQIITWAVSAHKLTDDWFFKMIEGELLRRFE